ncbi:MAG TPA: tRNA uracil 4-sulfurtransferase ThiI [Sedimentibacter sp.]|jgi:thiamine biosynthesis protein ThiI|nr:tRNA 4-thiouridine(8) synthase ThiI [Clostridiales bacterium]HOT22468.1 tRNA uracil 4-sulfurtransferase ThiI [Sedimentibacter sp.]HPY55471.1 tRNA uracil 4-sulfurtransferase ThiI [Sedimentibacter sp.]HQC70348.1 tRNA uracil 4-sulfurtransferase ThiI [Sedimentibacter sp.]
MYNIAAVSFGELFLKGKNRGKFEQKLIEQIKYALKEFNHVSVYKDSGKVYVETKNEEDMDKIVEKVRKIFGISNISPSVKTSKDVDIIIEKTIELFRYLLSKEDIKTFKIKTKRSDKEFPLKSMDFSALVGGKILENFSFVKVDVHTPDVEVYIDIKKCCYISSERIKTLGGLPLGSNGRALLLLSGGIDSPVAGYMIAKRGVEIDALYFHTYPFTSERANEKVIKLKQKLEEYCGKIKLYSINMLEIHKAIREFCKEEETTILARRFMMRIAEKIALENKIDMLITGESLGQVASQTMKSMAVIEDAINMPILKPLVGLDKSEIIEIAREIGTYETSILPYDDCCSVFAPQHPLINPKLESIKRSESNLNVEELIEKVLSTLEIL